MQSKMLRNARRLQFFSFTKMFKFGNDLQNRLMNIKEGYYVNKDKFLIKLKSITFHSHKVQLYLPSAYTATYGMS